MTTTSTTTASATTYVRFVADLAYSQLVGLWVVNSLDPAARHFDMVERGDVLPYAQLAVSAWYGGGDYDVRLAHEAEDATLALTYHVESIPELAAYLASWDEVGIESVTKAIN